MSSDHTTNRPPGMPCPYCNGISSIRTSRTVTPTYREIRYWCRNEECGAIFAASLTITHVIAPSWMTGAKADLPVISRGQPVLPANDDRLTPPTPANDTAMSETG